MEVLIAHKDAGVRESLKRVVQAVPGADLEVVESGDGAETVELLLAADSPHIAVVDWDLPGCDGLELCRLAQAYYEAGRPYLLVLAGKGHNVAEALDAGADDCVHLPVQADELRARIGVGRRFALQPGGRVVPLAAASEPRRDDALMLVAERRTDDEDPWGAEPAPRRGAFALESLLVAQ
jgi:DNA-binding response OmpR family regulator